jgi:hypothetical protein
MADDNQFPSGEAWDEYVWERFLQEQDRNAEKYFELLERFMDHPDRDAIIAAEMGWDILASACDGQEEVENFLHNASEMLIDPDEEIETGIEDEDGFALTPAYEETLRLHRWVDTLLENDASLRGNPEALRFATRSAVCGAKLAAALCGHDSSEIGMTIAYLKRSLKAANDSLESLGRLSSSGAIGSRQSAHGRRLVFAVRDRVVALMGEFRSAWRERHGR